jgi:YgiT-type zinc finger domain-containing protein
MATSVQLQRCVLCKGETHDGTTTLEFVFDGVTVIIDGVPAMV